MSSDAPLPPALAEIPLEPKAGPMESQLATWISTGLARSESIDCFDFVPCNYVLLQATLRALPPCRFCEWGSGIGVGVGIAAMLGFEACGIELDENMSAAARALMTDFDLPGEIVTGSYFDIAREAELYFVYCWPSQMRPVQELFLREAPQQAQLLICHGASDMRLKHRTG